MRKSPILAVEDSVTWCNATVLILIWEVCKYFNLASNTLIYIRKSM